MLQEGKKHKISTANLSDPLNFEETKPNLVVLADEKTGTIALMQQDVFLSSNKHNRLMINS